MEDLSKDLINCIKNFMASLKTDIIFNIYDIDGDWIYEITKENIYYSNEDSPIELISLSLSELDNMVESITLNMEKILKEDSKRNGEMKKKRLKTKNTINDFNKKIKTVMDSLSKDEL